MSHDHVFSRLTRELRFLVSIDTEAIVWRDEHAARLGVTVGASFPRLALEGCEPKCRELLTRAATSSITGWECAVVLGGRPTTVLFSAARVERSPEIAVVASLAAQDYADAVAEAGRTMHEIVALHRELAVQKTRLEESNTAIRSLLAELEQTADRLRATAEVKSRLIASISHEFRTPLHSVLGLARVLLSEGDGPLASEQRTQIELMASAASELSRMVDEMLDLARLDAGRAPIRIETFELRELLAAVSGTMRPLIRPGSGVELIVDPAPDVALETDHGKLLQILRNLIANALKFTTRGEVRVIANVVGDNVELVVKDTGIGIAEADQQRIFDEFVQLDSPRQREVKGSGLGLPLARKLAQSLGGTLSVSSEVGRGSSFTLSLPMEHSQVRAFRHLELEAQQLDPERPPVLVVEDERDLHFRYDRLLAIAGFQALPARTVAAARAWLTRHRPAAIILDVMLEGEDTWNLLREIKRSPETRHIPVLVCTVMNREAHARSLGADEFFFKPIDEDVLLAKLQALGPGRGARVLLIDDDATARYLVKKHLHGTALELDEAASSSAGIEVARSKRPDVILLDFSLGSTTAFDVLDQLAIDPRTERIPVVVLTSQLLGDEQRGRLQRHVHAVVTKDQLSRDLLMQQIRTVLR